MTHDDPKVTSGAAETSQYRVGGSRCPGNTLQIVLLLHIGGGQIIHVVGGGQIMDVAGGGQISDVVGGGQVINVVVAIAVVFMWKVRTITSVA